MRTLVVTSTACVTLALVLTIELKDEEVVRKFSNNKLSQYLNMFRNTAMQASPPQNYREIIGWHFIDF